MKSKISILTFSLLLAFCCTQTATPQQVVPYKIPGMEDVIVKNDIPYLTTPESSLKMDAYYSPKFDFKSKIPVVVFVLGYTDEAGKKLIGSKFKNSPWLISWCRIIAASGMAAILYESSNPEEDIISLSNYLKTNEDKLKIDNSRIGAFTCSAHTPTTISILLNGSTNIFKCAVVYYGFFLTNDFKYLSQIDTLSQNMGFKTPRLSEPDAWKKEVPIMIVRAGKDNVPYINQTLMSFYEKALTQNLPITLINYPEAPHGFEVSNDNETTRMIIKTTLDFWKFHLKI